MPESLLVQSISEDTAVSGQNNRHTLILSGKVLRGAKLKQKRLNERIILGEETLDYSKTVLETGTYYVDASVILGELNIIVPENYSVDLEMKTILAEVADRGPDPAVGPRIIVRGKVILGSVRVKVKKDGIIKRIINMLDN